MAWCVCITMRQRELAGMERVIEWLPRSGQPSQIRLAWATAIMGVAFLLQFGFARFLGLPGLSILLFAVFASAVVFNHGTGYYASALAIISEYYTSSFSAYRVPTLPGIVVFSVVCVASALFGEALRSALERAVAAERTTNILLREVQHRTQNTLSIMVALLELQARSVSSLEAKDALKSAANRVRLQAEAHRHLNLKEVDKVDAYDYLGEVCRLLERSLGGGRMLTIECEIEHAFVDPQKALALGLITNELVTNSLKYAYDEGSTGTIKVTLDRDETGLVRLRVRDFGRGCPDPATAGTGTQLIAALVMEHNGTYERLNRDKGCEVSVTLLPKSRMPAKGKRKGPKRRANVRVPDRPAKV